MATPLGRLAQAPLAHTADAKTSSSLVNYVIPEAIKRRTGPLPSLRRLWAAQPATGVEQCPPPPYAEVRDPSGVVADEEQDAAGTFDCIVRASGTTHSIYLEARETSNSDIRWKYVAEGCLLVDRAARETVLRDKDPELTRKLYIDGVGYLLRALPDLSADEILQLSQHVPPSLKEEAGNSDPDQQMHNQEDEANQDQRNHVYRIVTIATMHAVVLVSLLLPLLERLAATIYRCDQRYHISARLADTASQTGSLLARRAFALLREGRAGQIALGFALYTVEGASRGVLDGYGKATRRTVGAA